MPLDFPSSPTNGQSYAGYVYDSSLPGWRNVNSDFGVQSLNTMGLKNVVPTSVVVGSGSATVNSNGSVTFTGVSSVSLNGVFTSTYRNYRIVYTARNVAANTQSSWIRLRNAGTDVSTNYIWQGPDGVINSAGTNSNSSVGGWNSSGMLIGYVTPTSGSGTVEIMEPAIAASTGFHCASQGLNSSTNAFYSRLIQGENSIGSSYDSYTVYPQADTITGTMTVYGYNN